MIQFVYVGTKAKCLGMHLFSNCSKIYIYLLVDQIVALNKLSLNFPSYFSFVAMIYEHAFKVIPSYLLCWEYFASMRRVAIVHQEEKRERERGLLKFSFSSFHRFLNQG